MENMRRIGYLLIFWSCLISLSSCGGGDEINPAPAGASATLSWNGNEDETVHAYTVYYGKQSSGESGLCSYEHSQSVSSTSATITGLDFNTRYYFAVSASNGAEGLCSEEVSTVTASA